jgi:endonuclease YncB( thermonuclease family)
MVELKGALAAKARLTDLVAGGVRIVSTMDNDAFGRPLVRLYDRDGRDISEVLIAEGHARRLGGNERRQPWCTAPTGG